jgi:hypothetical protein
MHVACQRTNPNVEIRNKPEAQSSKSETATVRPSFSSSGFGFVSAFDIRHSDFPAGARRVFRRRGGFSVVAGHAQIC